MLQRTEKLLSVAAVNNYQVSVLGAWGCGVFKNNPDDVARSFHHHLLEKVVFAVLDNTKDESVVDAFRERFE